VVEELALVQPLVALLVFPALPILPCDYIQRSKLH
jgi:hypothetical protein